MPCIANQISFEKILRGNPHRSFAVNFRSKPFWYQADVAPVTLTTSTSTIDNPGSVYSEPVITVYGTGDITLMVGTVIVDWKVFPGQRHAGSELQEAYSGATGRNSAMSGEFPLLKPGMNAISWTGDVTKVEISPNWRYL